MRSTKAFIYLTQALLISVIFLYSCEKDNGISTVSKEFITEENHGFTVTTVKSSELKENVELNNKLIELKTSFENYPNQGVSKKAKNTFNLNTEEAILIKYDNGTKHSYTFAIESESDNRNHNLENIVLSYQSDGSYNAYLTRYSLSREERKKLNDGVKIDLSRKSSIEKIDKDQINLTNKIGCNYELTTVYLEVACSIDGCWDSEWTSWETMQVWIEVCSGGGSGGGGDNNSPGGGGGFGGGDNDDITPTIPMNPDGVSVAPSFLINALGGANQLKLTQINWINDHTNASLVNQFLNFMTQSGMSNSSVNLVNGIIDVLSSSNLPIPTVGNYPGKNEGFPFQWWTDSSFVSQNINLNLDEGISELTTAEKLLVAIFPVQALIIRDNKLPAEAETENRFGNNGINDKSDAFRHAFFNAMNSNDAGDAIARLFSTAHESEVPPNLDLEKQMDLFNNNVGHTIGANASFFVPDTSLANSVYHNLLNGSLVYLWPINYNDPNFWNNPLTIEPNDGNHGISNSTVITPTDQ